MRVVSAPGLIVAPVYAGWWNDPMESYALPRWVFTILIGLRALYFGLMHKAKKVQ